MNLNLQDVWTNFFGDPEPMTLPTKPLSLGARYALAELTRSGQVVFYPLKQQLSPKTFQVGTNAAFCIATAEDVRQVWDVAKKELGGQCRFHDSIAIVKNNRVISLLHPYGSYFAKKEHELVTLSWTIFHSSCF